MLSDRSAPTVTGLSASNAVLVSVWDKSDILFDTKLWDNV